MTPYLIIISVMFLAYILEGFHDHYLESLYNDKSETKYVKRWHSLDFVFHIIIGILISYLYIMTDNRAMSLVDGLILLANLGVLRMLVLNSTLNLLRGRKIYYLGQTSRVDILLKKIEVLVFILLVIINILLIYYQTR